MRRERNQRPTNVAHYARNRHREIERRERRGEWKDAYWIWDHNHAVEQNELLREEGFKVLGGSRYCYGMEHDRAGCLQQAELYGLIAPPSHRFEKPAAHSMRSGSFAHPPFG